MFEKIVLTPNGETPGTYAVVGGGLPNHFAPAPGCPQGGGYLIGWVINTSNQPIKFDGLIGDANLRPGAVVGNVPLPPPFIGPFAGSPSALGGYDAIPIQADPALANGAATTNSNGGLIFDGGAGHYQAVTGQLQGDVRYTNLNVGPTFTLGALTLLTLDVKSNRPNDPTFVDFDFFGGNPSMIGNENELSGSTDFICWQEFPITNISVDLITQVMGRKGVFTAQAEDPNGDPVTLLGLSEFFEGGIFPGGPASGPWPRVKFDGLFNSSVPVPTTFVPHAVQ